MRPRPLVALALARHALALLESHVDKARQAAMSPGAL